MATYSSAQYGRGPSQRRGEARRRGQWKLAYADFLTALMAFFLLLWLTTGSSGDERAAIAAYFTGRKADSAPKVSSLPLAEDIANPHQPFRQLDESLSDLAVSGLMDGQIQLMRDDAGFRIELTDDSASPLFDSSESQLNEAGLIAIEKIATLLSPLPVSVRVEGHTDAFPLPDYGNWKLSNARAHVAWEALTAAGLSADKFTAITGRGDSEPLLPDQPHAPANRRITLIVQPAAANNLN